MIAPEDCAARRIVKEETQGEAEDSQIVECSDDSRDWVDKPEFVHAEECSKEDPVDSENEGKDLDGDDSGEDDDSEAGRNKASTKKIRGDSETYYEIRERNIAENKKLLETLKVKYLVRDLKKVATRKDKRCVLCNHDTA